MLQVSKKRLASAKNYRMIKKRKGLRLIDALVEEKLLSEETEYLLRAQFSGMFFSHLPTQLLVFLEYHYVFCIASESILFN